jgi:acetyl esterase/lipase
MMLLSMMMSTLIFSAPQTFNSGAPSLSLYEEALAPAVAGRDMEAPALHLFPLQESKNPVPAVVVCPGGGYGGLATSHEGMEIARWLNGQGIAAFICQYRVDPYRHPIPLEDAQQALRVVRARAEEWNVDPERVGILGFSAGGHLVSTVSTHFDSGDPASEDIVKRQSSRPDFSVLIYPVISLLPPFGHVGSGKNLLGEDGSPELAESLQNDRNVTADTPPSFLVASTADTGVSAENSLVYYLALHRAGVPAEMHVYEPGPHGFGLGKNDPVLSTWPDLCIQWLRTRGILK